LTALWRIPSAAGSKLSDKEEQWLAGVTSHGRENPGGKSFHACFFAPVVAYPKKRSSI
jgi:hypothetical protein